MVEKIIFFEGCDESGKSSRALELLKTQEICSYFRSSYQIGSKFCGRKVDLELSIQHDWRILLDFIKQVDIAKPILLVDRGFISSYVYSKVIRKKDIWRYVHQYCKAFRDIAEFWFFFRSDYQNMDAEYLAIDETFRKVYDHLEKETGLELKRFYKSFDGHFYTDDFLDLGSELKNKRLDSKYYTEKIGAFLSQISANDRLIILDIDGVLVPKYSDLSVERSYYITNLYPLITKSKNVMIMTGRPEISFDDNFGLCSALKKRYHEVCIVYNNRNLGLSSRVLKEFCLQHIASKGIKFDFYDDRIDVIEHLFSLYDKFQTYPDIFEGKSENLKKTI